MLGAPKWRGAGLGRRRSATIARSRRFMAQHTALLRSSRAFGIRVVAISAARACSRAAFHCRPAPAWRLGALASLPARRQLALAAPALERVARPISTTLATGVSTRSVMSAAASAADSAASSTGGAGPDADAAAAAAGAEAAFAAAAGGPVEREIWRKLGGDEFAPVHLAVLNESHMHNVPANSETHFKVVVVSDVFHGVPLLARHRRVQAALKAELQPGCVHALSIVAKTPAQWEKSEGKVEPSPNCLGGSKR